MVSLPLVLQPPRKRKLEKSRVNVSWIWRQPCHFLPLREQALRLVLSGRRITHKLPFCVVSQNPPQKSSESLPVYEGEDDGTTTTTTTCRLKLLATHQANANDPERIWHFQWHKQQACWQGGVRRHNGDRSAGVWVRQCWAPDVAGPLPHTRCPCTSDSSKIGTKTSTSKRRRD